jgi:GAF domain-containing protein
MLADLAATAIDNARIYARSEERRLALEQAVHGLEASRDIADAIGSAADLEEILELVVERGRVLIGAQTVLVLLREGDHMVVAASAGQVHDARGRRVPIAGSTAGEVLQRGQPERIANAVSRMRIAPEELGVIDAHTALLMPIIHRGVGLGVLVAFDRGIDGDSFSNVDEQLLRTFAAAASNAVAIRRSVEADRLSSTIAAAEAERARWAREHVSCTIRRFRRWPRSVSDYQGRCGETSTRPTLRRPARLWKTSSSRSGTCVRSSRICARRCLMMWACRMRSRR